MIKESTKGLGMQLHLVAGPLNDAGAAAKICAVMTENSRSCETAVFDGQRLSFRSDDVAPTPAAPAKPTPHKRGASSKRAAAVVEEPPKKPETTSSISSSISSMFGRKSSQ
jgi:cell division septation protein DedD